MHAKIICTLGPASDKPAIVRKMKAAGMAVARLNFSHGTHKEHERRIRFIRGLNRVSPKSPIQILQDLEGYRIRVGSFIDHAPIDLKKRQTLLVTNEPILGDAGRISMDYEGDLKDICTGSTIFIDDGNLALLVKSRTRKDLVTEILVSGRLKENKGVNIPELRLKFKGLTSKDKLDLEIGLKHKVDFIAQSFVRDEKDMWLLRKRILERHPTCKLIAKIENQQGLNNLDKIISFSDGIMVARGDLGVSVPIYQIPMIQKMIIKKCNRMKKPVITATHMLESMMESPRPTRAEVTDVANAILDGTDYCMLSGETAAGEYPAESVLMMQQIMEYTEKTSAMLP